uniref:Uncharacterized protein n=1 Tax=Hyaloperonospora arabidopsidis (strain Emoy2) TaxID=559515 RepID=M4B1E9_HYAAE
MYSSTECPAVTPDVVTTQPDILLVISSYNRQSEPLSSTLHQPNKPLIAARRAQSVTELLVLFTSLRFLTPQVRDVGSTQPCVQSTQGLTSHVTGASVT